MPSDPFSGPPPGEVPLPRAPLERVVCQVRFASPLLAAEVGARVAPVQEELREDYPVLREEVELPVGPAGAAAGSPRTIWRFQDAAGGWRFAVARGFVALETGSYGSRAEFAERLGRVLAVVERRLHPGPVARIGLRYIDRLQGEALGRIGEFIRPELRGPLAATLAPRLRHGVAEAELDLDAGERLRARWGRLPAGATVDASLVPPIDGPSWVLDIDVFRVNEQPFHHDRLAEAMATLGEKAYRFFRWAVTDEFLEFCGGQP